MKNYAIILAGGIGSRMNAEKPKQYLPILGKPAVYYSLRCFQESPFIDEIVLVTLQGDIEYCQREIVEKYKLTKVKSIVSGGNRRYESVNRGLDCLNSDGYVFIHDGARPCIDQELINELYRDVQKYRATIAGVLTKDTVKIVNESKIVISTPNRSNIWNIQTPQVFEIGLIKDAYKQMMGNSKMIGVTDDSMVIEEFTDVLVHVSQGKYTNIKITTPVDLELAKNFLKKSVKKM